MLLLAPSALNTIVFERGTLVIKGPYGSTTCDALVFDAEGRLVGGRVNIPQNRLARSRRLSDSRPMAGNL